MKVNKIWQALAIFMIGAIFGIFITTKTFIKNIPESTSITIGKMLVKGKNNEVTQPIIIKENTPEKKSEKKIFKRKNKK